MCSGNNLITLSFYHLTICHNHSFILFSHSIIVYSRYHIPNLRLITCTYYHIVPLFNLVGCTSSLDLLKRHFKAVFHSILFSVRILFIHIIFIRLLFFLHILFIRIILICKLFFIRILFIRVCVYIYLGFLSRIFTSHRTAGEEGGYLVSTTFHFHRQLYISRAITAESSPLHIASSRTRTGNLWFRAQLTNH